MTPVIGFLLPGLLFLSLSRAMLILWQFDRVSESGGLWYILFQGVRFDFVVLAILLTVPFSFLPLFTVFRQTRVSGLLLIRGYLLIVTAAIVFLELATPNFIIQYDFRPNILMVEYLKYPKEILSMILKAYPLQLVIALSVTVAAVYAMNRHLTHLFKKTELSILWSAPLLTLLILVLGVAAARSTFDHRPVNPSTVAYSSDPLMNSLPMSSMYTTLYALYEALRYEKSNDKIYGDMPEKLVLKEIYKGMNMNSQEFFNPDIPTLHQQRSGLLKNSDKPKNIVIILEESLGADYVGALGGKDITPNLDALSKEGLWFNNLYATGTRSVRGIEAVITGFLPTPARSVVKLGGSQHGFFTIAQLLSEFDYSTSFIYGGEAHFDNMRRFFTNNGFSKIIDENDYVDPEFYGSWGASDEDLFNKAHEEFTEKYRQGKPFFSLVFTSSNHSPFDFPDNKIELVEQPKSTVSNAVKYADYALGEYIKTAKQSEYWKDTIFLIIADHSDRVYGNNLVPVKRFRIPSLILGQNIEPKVVNQICSQIDMLPTLLSLAGINATHPAIGHDLAREDFEEMPGRAIMQFGNNYAYMEEGKVVVLQKGKDAKQFLYREETLTSDPDIDTDFQKRALAHAIWPIQTYNNKSYRLPEMLN